MDQYQAPAQDRAGVRPQARLPGSEACFGAGSICAANEFRVIFTHNTTKSPITTETIKGMLTFFHITSPVPQYMFNLTNALTGGTIAGQTHMEEQPILSFDLGECQALLGRLEAEWISYDTPAPSFKKIFDRVAVNIGEATTTNQYIGVVKNVRERTAQLYLRLSQLGVLTTDELIRKRTNRLMEVVGFCVILINTTHRTQQAIESTCDPTDIGSTFYSFSSMTDVDGEDVKTYQRLLLHLFCQAQMHGYRRYGDSVYEPILTSDNFNTHSWSRVCDIRSFIYMSCQKEFHFNEWRLLTDHPSYPKNAESYLVSCEDYQFPRLVQEPECLQLPERHLPVRRRQVGALRHCGSHADTIRTLLCQAFPGPPAGRLRFCPDRGLARHPDSRFRHHAQLPGALGRGQRLAAGLHRPPDVRGRRKGQLVRLLTSSTDTTSSTRSMFLSFESTFFSRRASTCVSVSMMVKYHSHWLTLHVVYNTLTLTLIVF